jgi:DNA-binding winged helix-turn-helix (wHTH) protein/tetratricopeptide (TPR) repeat protein
MARHAHAASGETATTFCFSRYELDEQLYELRCDGHVVPVEPKVFDVLAYLVRHRARVVTKDELLDEVWRDQVVSESSIVRCVSALRRAIDDDGQRQRVIQTVHGRGYRFVMPVETRPAGDGPDPVTQATGSAPSCGDRLTPGPFIGSVATYIRQAGGTDPPEALTIAVHERTDGNPFFVTEVVRLLQATGGLETASVVREWRGVLPAGVREAIGRRLIALSERTRRLLRYAAVVGREFGVTTLAHLTATTAQGVLEGLQDAIDARIVAPLTPALGRCHFAHALVREKLYEELTAAQRVDLHRQVGEALEAVYGTDPQPHLAELAHHFSAAAPAGDVAKAVDYCVRAASASLRSFGYEEAAQLYDRALRALEFAVPQQDDRRCSILLALGDAHSRAGERVQSRAAFEQAAGLARSLGRPHDLAHAALGLGGRQETMVGPDAPLAALLEEALEVLGAEDIALRARVMGRLLGAIAYTRPPAFRASLSEEAVCLARCADDPATLVEVLGARFFALLDPDDVAERLAIGTEVLAIAERLGPMQPFFVGQHPEFLGHEIRLSALLTLGEMSQVDEELDATARVAERIRQPINLWYASWFRAGRLLGDGRFDEAERLIGDALTLGQRAQHPMALPVFGGLRVHLARERGRIDEIAAGLDALRESHSWATPWSALGILDLAIGLGRDREIDREFARVASDDFTSVPRGEHWLYNMSVVAEACARRGSPRQCGLVLELLHPYAGLNVVHDMLRTYRGSVAYFLAIVATRARDWQRATSYFETALEQNERMASRPAVARTQCELGRSLLAHDRRSDRATAREWLRRAELLAGDLGMAEVRQQAGQLVRRSA